MSERPPDLKGRYVHPKEWGQESQVGDDGNDSAGACPIVHGPAHQEEGVGEEEAHTEAELNLRG